MENKNFETATLAGGCFWCTEAVFKRVKGVTSVTSGYSGGKRENPSYDQVHSGATGHAEAIQIEFDPKIVSYQTLLEVFFATHNPTTLNQDGANFGEEYRSAIFYHDDEQRKIAEEVIKKLEEEKKFDDPIVTEITPYSSFYPAEEEHREFYERNPSSAYCRIIIDPKIKKLLSKFREEVKEEYI